MARRTKDDYDKVVTTIRDELRQTHVEWFMVDFEAATWKSLREVFPGTVVKGCVFHLTQRLYRKIQAEGLAAAYLTKGNKYRFLRKVMALPCLPVEQIEVAFDRLKEVAESSGVVPVINFMKYVDSTWVRGRVWSPVDWCLLRDVRTNNVIEGWHRRLNARAAHPNLGFYKLVQLLRGETETVDIQVQLVSQHLLTNIRRTKYVQIHGRLNDAWDKFEEEELTTTQLLDRVSHINGLEPV